MVIKFSSCSILEKYAFSSKKLLTFVSLWCGEDGTVLPFNLLNTALDSIDVVTDFLHLQNSLFTFVTALETSFGVNVKHSLKSLSCC